jgi:hypothetical protein
MLHQQQVVMAASARMQHYWYLTYPLGLLFAVVLYGLFAGISAFAYQALANETVPEPARIAPTAA